MHTGLPLGVCFLRNLSLSSTYAQNGGNNPNLPELLWGLSEFIVHMKFLLQRSAWNIVNDQHTLHTLAHFLALPFLPSGVFIDFILSGLSPPRMTCDSVHWQCGNY